MGHIALSFLFYNLLLLVFYTHYKKGDFYINKTSLIFYTILLIAYGTYGGGEGDYLHYRDRMEYYQTLADVFRTDMMEVQYGYLAYLVDGNYTLWRLVIYSVQFIGMSFFLYKAKLNTYPVFLCFVSYCLILSCYNRAGWGPIYFFMGLYLLLEKKNPLFLIAIALSYFAHTQTIALFALLPLAFLDFKKWHFVAVLLSFTLIVGLLKDSFSYFLNLGGMEEADYLSGKAQMYSESEISAFGSSIGEYTIFVLRYVPMAIIVISWIGLIFKHRNKYLSLYLPYRRVFNVTIGAVLLAVIVLFANLGAGTFFYRILSMALFPISILLPYLMRNGVLRKRTFSNYLFIFVLCSELNYIKDLYYAYVGGV